MIDEDFFLLLSVRYGVPPRILADDLTSAEYERMAVLSQKYAAVFWGVGGLT